MLQHRMGSNTSHMHVFMSNAMSVTKKKLFFVKMCGDASPC